MILCAGEALIDMLPRQSTDGALAFAPYPGGGPMNTAVALARLGQPTGFFSGVSNDLFGRQINDFLRANAVDTGYLARSDRPTTLAFVTLQDGRADYTFYDELSAGRMLGAEDVPSDLSGVDALFFGGICLAVEPASAAYEVLCLTTAPEHLVMLDPNIRPAFIKDEEAYRARLARMIAVADIVKLSDEDLHWIEGEGELLDLARGLLARGPKLVCLTEGEAGVTGVTGADTTRIASVEAEVIDTIGAGDTFNAGLLAGLAEAGALSKAAIASMDEKALRSALELGAAAAAITVSRAGANPPRRDEIPG